MNYFKIIDFYPTVHKEFANIKDVMKLTNCDVNEANSIMCTLVDECKQRNLRFYITNNNIIIPMSVFMKHFKLNINRLKRYHDSLCEFF